MPDTPSPLHIHFRFMAPTLMDIRTRLPAEALARDPALSISQGVDLALSSLPPAAPKLIVTQRAGPTDETAWLDSTARMVRAGWISVLEFDDHPYFAAAIEGRSLTDEMWRHFSHFHALQVSTPKLADLFAPWNSTVAVFPNAVFDLPPFVKRTGTPKVFYGAVTRGRIAVEVAASLAGVTARFPDVRFVVVGDRAVFEALPTTNKVYHDYLPFAQYYAVMRECDVSLSPLSDDFGLDYKSDAKFLDGSANSLVTIASPNVYAEVIMPGQTGFIAHGLGDWASILTTLLEDPGLRARVARNAWDYVSRERLFIHQAGRRRDWYMDLWARRHELTRQLMARSPRLHTLLTS